MNNLLRWIFRRCGLLSVVWTVTIFVLCATPGRFIPSPSWLELLSFDKLVHFSIFFILALLLQMSFRRARAAFPALYAILIAAAYGGTLEIMQATVLSDRTADWLDMIANASGALATLALRRRVRAVAAISA